MPRTEGPGQICPADRVLVCPRCRQPLKTIYVKVRRGREYLYGYHGNQRFCYLGVAGKYTYVERLLELDLAGLTFADYIEIMRRAFDKALDSAFRNPAQIQQLQAELLNMIAEICPEAWANLPKASTSVENLAEVR